MSSIFLGGAGGGGGTAGASAYAIWLAEGNSGTEADFLTAISAGADGRTVLNGTAVPTTEGVIGDFYIKTDTYEIYGPKTVGGWGSPTSLIGASGADGNGTPVEVVSDFPGTPTVGTLYIKVV